MPAPYVVRDTRFDGGGVVGAPGVERGPAACAAPVGGRAARCSGSARGRALDRRFDAGREPPDEHVDEVRDVRGLDLDRADAGVAPRQTDSTTTPCSGCHETRSARPPPRASTTTSPRTGSTVGSVTTPSCLAPRRMRRRPGDRLSGRCRAWRGSPRAARTTRGGTSPPRRRRPTPGRSGRARGQRRSGRRSHRSARAARRIRGSNARSPPETWPRSVSTAASQARSSCAFSANGSSGVGRSCQRVAASVSTALSGRNSAWAASTTARAPGLVELAGEVGLVRRPTGVGERPPVRAGEAGARDPAAGLRVEQVLVDDERGRARTGAPRPRCRRTP